VIQEYQAYPFPKSMKLADIMLMHPWPAGTKFEDGNGAWIVMVPVDEPFEGSL
jgi:hypothetical protein